MYNIVICIPTYKRPQMLEKLVLSINKVNINKSLVKEIDIVIVDNDKDRSAEEKVNELKNTLNKTINIEYHCFSKKGLANVRNELLKHALNKKPDFIVSVDDDEYVSEDWLNQLLNTMVNNNADIVLGPVIPTFEQQPPEYISYCIKSPDFDDQKNVNFFRTGQYMIKVSFLEKHNLRFDERFNHRGYEDSYFGLTAIKKGARIFWAKHSYVYETIPPSRMKLSKLLQRMFNDALNYSYVLKLEKKYKKFIKKIFVSVFYIITGIICLPVIITKSKFKYWGILRIYEGFGAFAGILNFKYNFYK